MRNIIKKVIDYGDGTSLTVLDEEDRVILEVDGFDIISLDEFMEFIKWLSKQHSELASAQRPHNHS